MTVWNEVFLALFIIIAVYVLIGVYFARWMYRDFIPKSRSRGDYDDIETGVVGLMYVIFWPLVLWVLLLFWAVYMMRTPFRSFGRWLDR